MSLRRRLPGGESALRSADSRPPRRVRWPVAILAFLFLAICGIWRAGLRLNFSPSLPRGLYRTTEAAPHQGSLVLVCVPKPWASFARRRGYLGPGSCPGGTEPLGKRVAALAGDEVELAEEGLRVNGKLLRETAPLRIDSRGRPMPALFPWCFSLRRGEILVFASHPRSFDSRYFGAIPGEAVIAEVEPIWVFERGAADVEPTRPHCYSPAQTLTRGALLLARRASAAGEEAPGHSNGLR